MKAASTAWKEILAADEAAIHERQALDIQAAHSLKNTRYGKGRFLHRKPILSAEGELEIHAGLPEHARYGLFARPGTFPVLARLSNGAFDIQANSKPDIRGFAFRVLNQSGPSSLGGITDHQDFLLINHDSFASRTSDDFMEIVRVSAQRKELGLIWFLIRKYGLRAGLNRVRLLLSTLTKPFSGFNSEAFSTALPFAVGPYAAKLRITPRNPKLRGKADIGDDIAAQLSAGPILYDVTLQFFTDEATTPIENPPVVWPAEQSPYVPVATLKLTKAGIDAEGLHFDPWGGLADHRPLGEIMRSRKTAYFVSQKARNG